MAANKFVICPFLNVSDKIFTFLNFFEVSDKICALFLCFAHFEKGTYMEGRGPDPETPPKSAPDIRECCFDISALRIMYCLQCKQSEFPFL